ncbi:unnamed protein product, partial [Ectocarpus sp. 12 AP-2014]
MQYFMSLSGIAAPPKKNRTKCSSCLLQLATVSTSQDNIVTACACVHVCRTTYRSERSPPRYCSLLKIPHPLDHFSKLQYFTTKSTPSSNDTFSESSRRNDEFNASRRQS